MDLDHLDFIKYIEEANNKSEKIRKKKMETYNGDSISYLSYISLDNLWSITFKCDTSSIIFYVSLYLRIYNF